MRKLGDDLLRHQGITIHKMPVAGAGGLLLVVGIVAITLLGLPVAKWFLLGAVVMALGVVGILKLFRKVHPQTEVEEVLISMAGNQRPTTKG